MVFDPNSIKRAWDRRLMNGHVPLSAHPSYPHNSYSASNLQGPLFQFFTNAFVFFCRMGTVGDVKLKVCIHVDKSFLIVCV